MGSSRPRIISLPAPVFPDDAPDVTAEPHQVDVEHWFRGTTRYVTLTSIPGTGFPLTNKYTLVTATLQPHGPENRSLRETLGINVRGNVIVLRHSITPPYSITNVHPSEKRLIDLVVLR